MNYPILAPDGARHPRRRLSLRFNREDGERWRKVAARRPRRHNESLWNIPISCAPFADRSTSA
jgi:hypothetical protein